MSQIESITIATTAEQKTVPGRFEAALQGATRALASSVVGAVELAAPAVPFGTVLAGAVRGPSPGLPGSGLTAARPAAASGVGALGAAGTSGGGSQAELLEATRALQQEAQTMNLQYLQLQERMQQENREFTTLSNVMRVRHDSARAAIANIH